MTRLRDEAILVDFYSGGYDPTIAINARTSSALNRIRNVFLDLANGRGGDVDLLRIENVFRGPNIDAFVLSSVSQVSGPEGDLVLQSSNERNNFHWSHTSEGWFRCVDLIDGIVVSCMPGHQYLIEAPASTAVVVVEFME